MNQVRVLKPVGVLMVGVACAATCKVGVTQPIQLGAGVACAPKNLVSLVHLKSAMF